MANKVIKPIVELKIESGPVSPHMKKCWSLFWERLIAETKREVAK